MEPKTKKIVLTTLLSLAGASTLWAGIYYTWLITPPAPPTTPQEAIDLVKSPRFERLPDSRKREYFEQTRKLMDNLPEEKRHEFFMKMHEDPEARESMRKAMERRMSERTLEYAKATPEERIKMLDEIIDRMEARRGQRPPGPDRQRGSENNRRGRRGGPGGRGFNLGNRIKQHVQEGNPQMGGLMHEFHQAMRARMKERGIEPRGPR